MEQEEAVRDGRMEEFMKTTTNFGTRRMVQLALFTAIIVLMAFTPLGYIKTVGLSITLLSVPVAVGAILLGPTAGAILGGVFGLTSFAQCFGLEPFGTALFGINPIGVFILCMVPRILMGWLTGLVFLGIKKVDKTKNLSYAVSCLLAPLLNTVLFMPTLMLFFYNYDKFQDMVKGFGASNVLALIFAMAGVNALAEAAICFILGTAISKALDVFARKSGMK